MYDPVKLAEDIAVLDHLSGGRIGYTIGLGYREEEYAMFGIDPKQRGKEIEDRIHALRNALRGFYPVLKKVKLTDYKVRVVEQASEGTGAIVRVLVESSDGERHWGTVGASTNLIEASWQAPPKSGWCQIMFSVSWRRKPSRAPSESAFSFEV